MNPNILLMDEPLSALDALTRGTLQREFEKLWGRDQKTVILITNDVDEGLVLADKIIPLNPGPEATLGPAFEVELPRPREKTELNNNFTYKRLRNDIIEYLMDVGARRKGASQTEEYILPDLEPVDLTEGQYILR